MRPGKNRLKRLDDVSQSVGIIENTAYLPIERVFESNPWALFQKPLYNVFFPSQA